MRDLQACLSRLEGSAEFVLKAQPVPFGIIHWGCQAEMGSSLEELPWGLAPRNKCVLIWAC